MPVQNRFIPSTTIARHNSVESLSTHGERFSGGKISIDAKSTAGMRRVLSESDVIRSERTPKSVGGGSKPSPARIAEDEEEDGFFGGGGSGFSGGDGRGGGDGYDDRSRIGDYYREMLKSDPNNSLLLMNYGKFLYEVTIKVSTL